MIRAPLLALLAPLLLAGLAACAPVEPPAPRHTMAEEIAEAVRQVNWCMSKPCPSWTPEQRLRLYLQDHPDGFELGPMPQ